VFIGSQRPAIAALYDIRHPNLYTPGGAPQQPSVTPPSPSSSSLLYCQRVQYRFFDSRRKRKRKKAQDPFKVLKIPEGILYKDAKKSFLMVAMKNHPDTAGGVTEEERETMRDIFIRSRIAFESLTEDDTDGTAIRKDDAIDVIDNFDSWFKGETGFDSPFQFDMDPETMKEVANMTETIGGDSGLDRDGGMWALARMVTSTVKAGGDAASMLRLDAGDPKDPKRQSSLQGELRRRRRR
jgi:hypothetical protein